MRILYTLSFMWLLMLVPVSEASGQELDAKYATTLLPPGSMAPDFSIPSIVEGDTVSLSHVLASGSYVIVDFWASWCGPCRAENPNVKKIYAKYHDKGLEIIGVSLDEDKQQWETAIDKLGIKWLQLSDLKGWENAVARQFDVNSIPYTIIVDNKGQTLATDLRGESLQTFIAERLD